MLRHNTQRYFIKLTTTVFSKSYLVKNDAPLSVLRGFKKKGMDKYFRASRHYKLFYSMEMGIQVFNCGFAPVP